MHLWRWCKRIRVHIGIQLCYHMSECFLSKVLVRFQVIDNKDSAIMTIISSLVTLAVDRCLVSIGTSCTYTTSNTR